MSFTLNDLVLFLYFSLYTIIFSISIIAMRKNSRCIDITNLVFISLFFVVFIFNRNGFGVDEPVYLDYYVSYSNSAEFPFGFSFEFLYLALINMGVGYNSFNDVICLLYFFITLILVFVFVSENNKSFILISFLFTSVSIDLSFNTYRQAFAVLFYIFSLFSFINKRFFYGLVLSLISCGFHWSVAILFLLFMLSRFISETLSFKLLLLSFLLHICSLFFDMSLMSVWRLITSFLPNDFPFMFAVERYIDKDANLFFSSSLLARLSLLIPVLFLLIWSILCFNRICNRWILPLVAIISLFAFLFLGMPYSFRNYYWLLPLFPFLLIVDDRYFCLFKQFFIKYISPLYIYLWGTVGFFSSAIIRMLYLS